MIVHCRLHFNSELEKQLVGVRCKRWIVFSSIEVLRVWEVLEVFYMYCLTACSCLFFFLYTRPNPLELLLHHSDGQSVRQSVSQLIANSDLRKFRAGGGNGE